MCAPRHRNPRCVRPRLGRAVSRVGRAEVISVRIRVTVNLTYNALPVDVASGSCPEVRLWDITLLAKSYSSTGPRSRFLGSFTYHFDGLPTIRPSAAPDAVGHMEEEIPAQCVQCGACTVLCPSDALRSSRLT